MKRGIYYKGAGFKVLWLFQFVLFFCLTANAQEEVIKKENESLTAFVKRIIPPDSELAYKIVTKNVAKGRALIVVLFRQKFSSSNYSGWVLTPSRSSPYLFLKFVLPPMKEIENHFDIAVNGVFFEDINYNNRPELFILYEYHRAGSQMDDGYSIYVYELDANTFVILDKATKVLGGLKTEKAVRAKLKKLAAAAAANNDKAKEKLLLFYWSRSIL